MIIGITGTTGAGKGTIVAYLVEQKGFTHYSARSFLAEKMEEAGIPINRDTMIDFANTLREKHGPRYVFDELYKRAQAAGTPAIIESIRTTGEVDALKEQGGMLLSIDAPQEVRYARIHGRNSALDRVTFEEFQKQEEREMHSNDPHKQNIAEVMAMADFNIENSVSVEDLYAQVEAFLKKIQFSE